MSIYAEVVDASKVFRVMRVQCPTAMPVSVPRDSLIIMHMPCSIQSKSHSAYDKSISCARGRRSKTGAHGVSPGCCLRRNTAGTDLRSSPLAAVSLKARRHPAPLSSSRRIAMPCFIGAHSSSRLAPPAQVHSQTQPLHFRPHHLPHSSPHTLRLPHTTDTPSLAHCRPELPCSAEQGPLKQP